MPDLFFYRVEVHQGSNIRVVDAVPNRELSCFVCKAATKLVVDGAFDIEPIGTEAILPGGCEFRRQRARDRMIQIGIREHQEWRVAPQLHHQSLHGIGALTIQKSSHLGRAGEGDRPNPGSFHPFPDQRSRISGEHVENTGRRTRTLSQFGQGQRRQRCFPRRMGDHRAARSQRGGGLARQHGAGEIPGRNQPGDPQRLTPQFNLPTPKVRGDAFNVGSLGLFRIELNE